MTSFTVDHAPAANDAGRLQVDEPRVCLQCGTTFTLGRRRLDRVVKFCSYTCFVANRVGKTLKVRPWQTRLWANVRKGGDQECWPWQGARDEKGYGLFSIRNRHIRAHRSAYLAATGIDPADLVVCHHCDNPPCCNPNHLFLGTIADNNNDKMAKGRNRAVTGEDHPRAKITTDQVSKIQGDSRSHRAIAASYGLSKTQVGRIKRGESWRSA